MPSPAIRRPSPRFLPYARHRIGAAEERAVISVLRGPTLTQGPWVEALEEAFALKMGRRHAVAVSSGTAALHAAVEALRLPPGSEVITTPLTFAATANAIVHAGDCRRRHHPQHLGAAAGRLFGSSL
jgi:perosamine synthetase